MECNKVLSEVYDVRCKLEKALVSDVSSIIDIIFQKYDIRKRGQSDLVEILEFKNDILNFFRCTLNSNSRCTGITKTGTRCTRRAYGSTYFCNSHAYLQHTFGSTVKQIKTNMPDIDFEQTPNETNKFQVKHSSELQKKLIDDSFYLHDNKYVYDYLTHEKVGYIDNNTFVFTDDPFELGTV